LSSVGPVATDPRAPLTLVGSTPDLGAGRSKPSFLGRRASVAPELCGLRWGPAARCRPRSGCAPNRNVITRPCTPGTFVGPASPSGLFSVLQSLGSAAAVALGSLTGRLPSRRCGPPIAQGSDDAQSRPLGPAHRRWRRLSWWAAHTRASWPRQGSRPPWTSPPRSSLTLVRRHLSGSRLSRARCLFGYTVRRDPFAQFPAAFRHFLQASGCCLVLGALARESDVTQLPAFSTVRS